MLSETLQLLQLIDTKTNSEVIEIAKGKYQLPTTFKQLIKKIKRQWQ